MKVGNRVKYLVRGDLIKAFPGDGRKDVQGFLEKSVIPAGQCIVVMNTKCGCTRYLHYALKKSGLIFKPGMPEALRTLSFEVTIHTPKDTDACAPLPMPFRWVRVPSVTVGLEVDHVVLDAWLENYRTREPHSIPKGRAG